MNESGLISSIEMLKHYVIVWHQALLNTVILEYQQYEKIENLSVR